MICPDCGFRNAEDANFCQNCGGPLSPTTPQAKETGTSTRLQSNIAGLLCYVLGWVSGLVFVLIERKSQFVRFHAWQSIITFGGLTIISSILEPIPFIGGVTGLLIGLLSLVLWIILMIRAYQDKSYKLPIVGDWAERLARGKLG